MKRLTRECLVKRVKNAKTGKYQPSINEVVFWYDNLNEHIFENDLPKLTAVIFRESKDYWGAVACERYKRGEKRLKADLYLSHHFESFKEFVRVMAHEMVHIWEFDNFSVMGHGERFFQWETKLKKFGIE